MISLTKDEYIKLVNGRFNMHRCTVCDGKGWYWVHEDGEMRTPRRDESIDDFYRHECSNDDDECGGVGFHVVYHD